jgi:ribonuclease E
MNTEVMLIDAAEATETRVVILREGDIEHFDFVSKAKQQIKGNIYLAKITRVEPSLQAAFVEYGGDKQGFLSFSEIHPDYYQIPVEDRQKLLEEVERMNAEEDEAEEKRADVTPSPVDTPQEDVRAKKVRRRGGGRKTLRKPLQVEGETEENIEPITATEDDAPSTPIAMSADTEEEVIARAEFTAQEDTAASEEEVREGEEAVVESGSKDEAEELRHTNFALLRRYKIQEVIRPGQLVLVQVIKEERGNKGVSLSTYISLAGRYCVVMPNSPKGGGISRKIGSGDDRKRLREISDELKEMRGMSAIIRTAGMDRSKAEIKRDYEYLIKLWNQVREDALNSIAPALVYEENDIIKRSIRDHYDGQLEAIIVQGDVAYKKAKEFMKLLMPSHAAKIKNYKEGVPLFAYHGVEAMLGTLYRPTAPLKSGGYLVINPTEALISVDVNSGRSTNEKNVEETAYRTNLEACNELARQLRLRNLGGLIVVDFIDMAYHKYRRNVEKALKDALKTDRAKIQIGHISTFGLLELSRQRIGSSLEESTTHTCPTCLGTGRVPRPDAIILQLLRNLQHFLSEHGEGGVVTISIAQALLLELLNDHAEMISKLRHDFKVEISFELHPDDKNTSYLFRGRNGLRFDSEQGYSSKNKVQEKKRNKPVHKKERSDAAPPPAPQLVASQGTVEEAPQQESEISTEERPKKSRRRGRRGGKNQQRFKKEQAEGENVAPIEEIVHAEDAQQSQKKTAFSDVSEEKSTIVATVPENVRADEVTEPQTPQERRKGWWQRMNIL